MASFDLSYLADADLAEILTYTIQKWGGDQAVRYAEVLDQHFEAIAQGQILTKKAIPHCDDFLISRCQKHVVFHCSQKNGRPLIIAVLHEKMDLMARLHDRMSHLGV